MHNSFMPAEVRLEVSDDAPLGGAIVFSTDVNVVRLHQIKLLNLLSIHRDILAENVSHAENPEKRFMAKWQPG